MPSLLLGQNLYILDVLTLLMQKTLQNRDDYLHKQSVPAVSSIQTSRKHAAYLLLQDVLQCQLNAKLTPEQELGRLR